MADPVSTAQDVRTRLNLPDETESGISNDEIETFLSDAVYELSQSTSLSALSDEDQKQLEWRLAGIEILSHYEGLRAYRQNTLGSASKTYEVKSVEQLKEWVKQNGPPGLIDEEFWHVTRT